MRVILVGPRARLDVLRPELPDGLEVIGEAASLDAARSLALEPDAYLVARALPSSVERLVEPLTARESQVLGLLADGLANKTIASRLEISDETVKFHLAAIFGKLGAANRTDAVRRALKHGLVQI
jgi:DNA-binding NarL/FixJ family response regulator